MRLKTNKIVIIKVLFLTSLCFWFEFLFPQRLSTGNGSVLYICEDSTVSAIGNNSNYQLGDGTNINRYFPVKVKGLHNVIGVNAVSSLALLSDSTLWQWSFHNAYHLNKINIDNVIYADAGAGEVDGLNYGALKNDGSLWLWGVGPYKSPNLWSYTDSMERMDMPKVKKFRAGNGVMIALCDNNSIWCWGLFYPKILTPQFEWSPPVNVSAIAAGFLVVFVLLENGTVWIMGQNGNITPLQMNVTDVKYIFAGNDADKLYAIKSDNSVWYWDNPQNYTEPTVKMNNNNTFSYISTSGMPPFMDCTYAIDNIGNIYRWGYNNVGQLGNFTTYPIDSPEMMPRPCLAVNCDTITNNQDFLKLDTAVYPGVPVNLTASKSEADLYWWYPRSNVVSGKYNQEASVMISGDIEFSAVIMDTYGCMRKERFMLRKKCESIIKVVLDTITYPGATINLKAGLGNSYFWTPSTHLICSNCMEAIATIYDSVTYSVSYTNIYACPAQEKFIIRIRDCDTIIKHDDTLILDTLITPGSAVKLAASKANSYQWLPTAGLNCDTCQTPVARVYDNTEFSVSLTDKYMCKWTERFKITNNCDTGSLNNPKVVFDSVSYPTAKIIFNASDSKLYDWQPSAGLSCSNCSNPTATVTDSIEYIVSLTDSFNCISKEKFVIRIRNCDTIQLKDTIVRLDTIIHFSIEILLVASHSYSDYKWIPVTGLSCSDCQNPVLHANTTSRVMVRITDPWLCPFYEIFNFRMVKAEVVIPNVFTPNSDGVNEYFLVQGLMPKSTLDIYDSNGTLVFSSRNYQSDWSGLSNSGKELGEGTYWYILNIPENGRYQGWVYLKRK
jgi:gliding motility-associated-like protein